jgi:hypothetical protein
MGRAQLVQGPPLQGVRRRKPCESTRSWKRHGHGGRAYLGRCWIDVAYQNVERDFMNINTVPLFYGNMSEGHGGTWNQANGGEFGRVGEGWLDWQL